MHIAVLINLYFGKVFCDCHLQTSPTVCYSFWSYVVALGWCKCRLLSKGHCSSQACSLWSCLVNQRTGLLVNSDLAGWVLPDLLARKWYCWFQGEEVARGGHWEGQGAFLYPSHFDWLKAFMKLLPGGRRWLLCLGIHLWQKAACLFQG